MSKPKGNLIASVMASIAPSFFSNNPAANESPTQDDMMQGIYDFQDSVVVAGDLVGIDGPASLVNVSAREIYFEPFLMQRLFEVHAPWRRSINPYRLAFDRDGVFTDGTDTATSVNLSALSGATALVALALVFSATDTLSGAAFVTLTNSTTGFTVQAKLDNINKTACLVALAHSQDSTINSNWGTVTFAAGVATLPYSQAASEVASQYYFDYTGYAGWTITATNATVLVYPVLITRDVNALIYACITTGNMKEFPNLLAQLHLMDPRSISSNQPGSKSSGLRMAAQQSNNNSKG